MTTDNQQPVAVGNAHGQRVPVQQVLAQVEQFRRAGRLQDAANLCGQILKARPDDARALNLLSMINHQAGNFPAAIELLKRATVADPGNALFQCNLCEMCRQAGRLDEALAAGLRAIEIRPDYPEAHNNLGIVYFDREQYDEAMGCYEKAFELRPDFAEALSNIGNALRARSRFDEAIASYEKAVTLKTDYAVGISNLGTTLQMIGRREEAMDCFDRALALDPNLANAHSGRSLILLLEGKFAEGWREYEWRWGSSDTKIRPPPGRPWRGEDIRGKNLLVYAEQGFGDSLQFCRYLPILHERGANLQLRVPPQIESLISHSMPWLDVSSRTTGTKPYDMHVALLSLPGVMGTRLDNIPAQVPYLRAREEDVASWRDVIADDQRLKVGIVWTGNLKHLNNPFRSVPMNNLAQLLAVEGVQFISLQVGKGVAAAEQLEPGSITLPAQERYSSYAATAGLVENLDLVITICTSVAHLTGALGKPLWVMIAKVPDWRWMLDREDNPWYPTARLFRQKVRSEWEELVERVRDELAAVVAGDRSRLMPFANRSPGSRAGT